MVKDIVKSDYLHYNFVCSRIDDSQCLYAQVTARRRSNGSGWVPAALVFQWWR